MSDDSLYDGAGDAAPPPRLEQVLPDLLSAGIFFIDCRSWCRCLAVNTAARDAVRTFFSGFVPGGPRPEEGWTGVLWRFLITHLRG